MAKPSVYRRADIQHRKDSLPEGGTYIKTDKAIMNRKRERIIPARVSTPDKLADMELTLGSR